jgi:hypothetical protein
VRADLRRPGRRGEGHGIRPRTGSPGR